MKPIKKFLAGIKTSALLLRDVFVRWNDRDPFRNSTVIAYYTIFSLPGLLVIVINLAGYFFGNEAVMQEVNTQVGEAISPEAARDVEQIITNASARETSVLSSIIGIATLLFGATGVFYQIQQTLNIVWEVKPEPKRMFLKFIKDRLFSFGLVLAIGFLLMVSLVLSALLSTLNRWLTSHFSEAFSVLFKILDFIISIGVITFLFAAIYKFLPDVKIRWKDVWVGALVTSLLFVIAKFALGLYFGNSDPASMYGAAGSIILIMLWVTYSAMILLFGAEFTQVYASRYGARIRPSSHARAMSPEEKAEESKGPPTGKPKVAKDSS